MKTIVEDKTEKTHSEQQAEAQAASIVEMVLNLTREGAAENYVNGLKEAEVAKLWQEGTSAKGEFDASEPLPDLDTMRDEVMEMIVDETVVPEGYEFDEDAARQTIQEDPLSVEVRSGWVAIGDEMNPEEFCILLCTGGPACRIVGKLNQHSEPCRARIEHQDWGTPWQEAVNVIEQDTLLEYCRQFYFGD